MYKGHNNYKKEAKRLIRHERKKVEKCVVALVTNAFEMATTTGN